MGNLPDAAASSRNARRSLAHRLGASVRRELGSLASGSSLALGVIEPVTALLPEFTLAGTRVALLRAAGVRIGHGTAVQGAVHFVGRPKHASRVVIGRDCIIAPRVSLGVDAPITIGDRVALGPGVTLCTATHVLGFGSRRMNLLTDARPITIGNGAWICMNALVLPGVHVGEGAVVGAGAVVTEDVRPHTLVLGNPATFAEELPFAGR